jgi:cysteine peptidase B
LQEDEDELPEAPAQCSHLGHTPSRVKAVQDQGGCGSCWAFAIAGACEGTAAVMGFDVKLSESWLLGCTSYDGMDPPAHMGCMGGNMPMIMESIIQIGDTIPDTDLAHPYQPFHDVEQGMNPQCKENQEYERGVKLVPHSPEMMVLSLSTEYDMKMWLCQRGPLMVALDATYLQNYSGGIIDTDEGCTVADRLNHAVVLVEYTTVGEDHYYKMKNSWGETWGEDGFFRVTTGRECMGLGTVAEVCKPGPVSSDFTPPPTTNSPTTSDSPVTTSPTPTTTKPATTVSTTTEATKPSDPCSNPLGEICKRACARGFQFFIDLFC